MLLKFTAVWCAPCKIMQREVFSRKDVAGALAKWITVSIDGDKQPSAVSSYKIQIFPTFIALDSDGKEVFRYEGAMSADEFIRFIQDQSVPQYAPGSPPGRAGTRPDVSPVLPDPQLWRPPPTPLPASTFLPRLPMSQDRSANLTGRSVGHRSFPLPALAGLLRNHFLG